MSSGIRIASAAKILKFKNTCLAISRISDGDFSSPKARLRFPMVLRLLDLRTWNAARPMPLINEMAEPLGNILSNLVRATMQ
jgi:hypothetical protein